MSFIRIFLMSLIVLMWTATGFAEDQRALSKKSSTYINENRTALIIGNSNYQSNPLRNPVNDAKLMADILKKVGFKVNLHVDISQKTMKRAIDQFGRQLQQRKGVGLFFYAGHGVQVRGRNYLIPVSAKIQSENDVEYEAIDGGRVLAKMKDAGNRVNVVILDACRNNPFARSYRSAEQGLATVDAPVGSFIAYATAPGQVAADGSGSNSMFSLSLAETIADFPGLAIEDVFKQVRSRVRKETDSQQVPWTSSSMEGHFYFNQSKQLQTNNSRSNGSFNLDDIEDQVKAKQQNEQRMRQEKQKRFMAMKAAYQAVMKMAAKSTDVAVKKAAWQRFVDSFSENFLWTQEDEAMLKYASDYLGAHIDPVIEMPFAKIPEGCFKMGDSFGDGQSDEQPTHVVCLDAFYMSKYEVTNAQFKQYKAGHDSGHFKGQPLNYPSQPVVKISHQDAVGFANWLSSRTGFRYRLPTEAEWEYAARAGTVTTRYWGDEPDKACGYANVSDLSLKRVWRDWRTHRCYDGYVTSAPVGKLKPNKFGLHDMLGNVWEWTSDYYGDEYYEVSPKQSPKGPITGTTYVIRGGSWHNDERNIKVSNRNDMSPATNQHYLGMRLVMDRNP